jgi:P27 family predicted phage terminase small subunit
VPRAKKPAGTAVDRRNGERAAFAPAVPLSRFSLPRRSDGEKYDLRTQRMWKALFDDLSLSSVLIPADRELVVRWAQSVDDWIKALESARETPIGKGSMGQDVASPYYSIAGHAMTVIVECERQLGIGALNRARLGIAVLAERAASLADLSSRFPGDGGGGSERDPRLG